MAESLDDKTIRRALKELGEHLHVKRDVEILLVGGAAGILIHELPAAWTTADVDVIHCHRPQDREAVLAAAEEVGKKLSLPASWLNEWSGLHAWTLPDDWKNRRILVGKYGRLNVYAVNRLDLISMKFLAHRERDLEHLEKLKVTTAEKISVAKYLDSLSKRYPERRYAEKARAIELAKVYLSEWKTQT